jgi:hypothetical protein
MKAVLMLRRVPAACSAAVPSASVPCTLRSTTCTSLRAEASMISAESPQAEALRRRYCLSTCAYNKVPVTCHTGFPLACVSPLPYCAVNAVK